MKKDFLTGLAILLPITITIVIIVFLVDLLTAPFVGFAHDILKVLGQNITFVQKHQTIVRFFSRLVVLAVFFLFIFFLGYLGNKLFSNFLQNTFHKLFLRIPFIKKIYKMIRDIVKTIFADKKNFFESTVIVPFPYEETYALGFLSGPVPDEAKEQKVIKSSTSTYKTVFVPTSPHPVGGFLLMVKESKIDKIPFTTEETFKFLVSAGVFNPEDQEKKTSESDDTD